ncbi:hypothetical protein D920_02786 [Enterococcus faecalis 13-SD-W-01]|nr:hypothetical protein D920_02786 [Enterococcus faecalis 13-SD-W-01]
MKKIIGLLIVLAIFIGGSWGAYNYFYGGSTYYTKIVTNGEKETGHTDTGEGYNVYIYDQKAYNEKGESKDITLREERDRPLKMNAYLKLSVNPRKGVMGWEEVKQSDVPDAALDKLE